MPAHKHIWEWKDKADFGLCLCWWYPVIRLLPWLSDAILMLDQCLEAVIDPECSNDVDLSAPHFPYIAALLCELQWFLVSFLVQFKVLGIPFRVLNGMTTRLPAWWLLSIRIIAHPTRSDRMGALQIPSFKCYYIVRAFSVNVPAVLFHLFPRLLVDSSSLPSEGSCGAVSSCKHWGRKRRKHSKTVFRCMGECCPKVQ